MPTLTPNPPAHCNEDLPPHPLHVRRHVPAHHPSDHTPGQHFHKMSWKVYNSIKQTLFFDLIENFLFFFKLCDIIGYLFFHYNIGLYLPSIAMHVNIAFAGKPRRGGW